VFSALIGAAGIGLLLGVSLRVPAVLAASAAIVVVSLFIAPFADVHVATAALTTLGSLVALQCGYLGGLAVACAWSRVRSPAVRQLTLNVGRWSEERGSSHAR
jgi:hypothetical protein